MKRIPAPDATLSRLPSASSAFAEAQMRLSGTDAALLIGWLMAARSSAFNGRRHLRCYSACLWRLSLYRAMSGDQIETTLRRVTREELDAA
jgi:hypothetical protein